MDYFYLYLIGTIGLVLSPFPIILFVSWLVSSCKRCIASQRDLYSNMHPATWHSIWPRRNSSRANIPLAIRARSPTIASVHRFPREAHQSNAMTNAPPSTKRSERATPIPSGPPINNSRVDVPLANQQSPIMVPMPCGCRTHQSNVLASAPPQTLQPQTMTPMRYGPHSSNGRTDMPVTNILQSQIMAHINHGPHRSQTMTPMRYGSQTNARAHTPHRPHRSNSRASIPHATNQRQMMAPEPRERPNSQNSDICAYISASIYQKYENDKNTECAVCLARLKRGELVMRMPICSHVYHEKCICRWLLQEPSCPLCRSPVKAQLSVRVGHG